jgi:hypothetical protein
MIILDAIYNSARNGRSVPIDYGAAERAGN